MDWKAAQHVLGFRPPADYQRLIETYGEGCFDDFLWLLRPGSSNRHLAMELEIVFRRKALAEVPDGSDHDPGELIPWAVTDNGDVCYWRTGFQLDQPENWQIAVNESRGPEWSESRLSTTDWLCQILSGDLRLHIFPEDFPSLPASFRSAPQRRRRWSVKPQFIKPEAFTEEVKRHFGFLASEHGLIGPLVDIYEVRFASDTLSVEVGYDEGEGSVSTLVNRALGWRYVSASISCLYVEAQLGPAQRIKNIARSGHSLEVAVRSHADGLRQLLPLLQGPAAEALMLKCLGR